MIKLEELGVGVWVTVNSRVSKISSWGNPKSIVLIGGPEN